jgi:hypothetical protein
MLDHHASIGKVDLVGDFASKGHLECNDGAGHAILRELTDGDQNLFHGLRSSAPVTSSNNMASGCIAGQAAKAARAKVPKRRLFARLCRQTDGRSKRIC